MAYATVNTYEKNRHGNIVGNDFIFTPYDQIPMYNEVNPARNALWKGRLIAINTWIYAGEIVSDNRCNNVDRSFEATVQDKTGHQIQMRFPPSVLQPNRYFDVEDLEKPNTVLLMCPLRHPDLTDTLKVLAMQYVKVFPCEIEILQLISKMVHMSASCWTCMETDTLTPCSKCQLALFCNEECKDNEIEIGHHYFCDLVKEFDKLLRINYDVNMYHICWKCAHLYMDV